MWPTLPMCVPWLKLLKRPKQNITKVIRGLDVPIEERPDYETDSFGDNGINMFIEFWIHTIDDGTNRVGVDLLL